MKTKFLFFILLVSFNLNAQNWRGVSATQSNYFVGGDIVKYIEVTNSVGNSNGDSVFTFYKTVRDSSLWFNLVYPYCLDTSAPTWLGKALYRNNTNGIEKYTNFKNDTIYINTLANVGDSWPLTTDTGNTQIVATVLALDTLTIDGVVDSIKKITLQQFTNGIATNAYYNAYTFILSKQFGWQTITDLYCFTAIPQTIYFAFPYYPTTKIINSNKLFNRLNTNQKSYLQAGPDMSLKFQNGNAWEYEVIIGNIGKHSLIYYHDSIYNVAYLGNNIYNVTFNRKKWGKIRYEPSNAAPYYANVYSDTTFTQIVDNTFHTLPEYWHTTESTKLPFLKPDVNSANVPFAFYSVATDTNNILSVIAKDYLAGSTLCIPGPSLSGAPAIKDYVYNSIYGITKFDYTPSGTWTNGPTYSFKLIYAKYDSLLFGTKINLATLSTSNVKQNLYAIYPNPTKNILNIEGIFTSKDAIKVYNYLGQEVSCKQSKISNTKFIIETSGLPVGLYYIKTQNAAAKFFKE